MSEIKVGSQYQLIFENGAPVVEVKVTGVVGNGEGKRYHVIRTDNGRRMFIQGGGRLRPLENDEEEDENLAIPPCQGGCGRRIEETPRPWTCLACRKAPPAQRDVLPVGTVVTRPESLIHWTVEGWYGRIARLSGENGTPATEHVNQLSVVSPPAAPPAPSPVSPTPAKGPGGLPEALRRRVGGNPSGEGKSPSQSVQRASSVKGSGLASKLRQISRPGAQDHKDRPPHLMILAGAGTGKTTTVVEGVKITLGMKSEFTPSEEQRLIWEEMSRGPRPASVGMGAFSRTIADELERRVPPGCDARSMHSLGLRCVRRHFSLPQDPVNKNRVMELTSEILGESLEAIRKGRAGLLYSVNDLVRLCKLNLVETQIHDQADQINVHQALQDLVDHYDLELGHNGALKDQVFSLVPQVLERCKDLKDLQVDYNDMVWLPTALNLEIQPYDLFIGDETQDWNRAQQALALKAGRRLVLVGDPRQAVFGFAGADAQSMPRQYECLRTSARGCTQLSLTYTRRCAKSIVKEANQVVPHFYAFDSNPEGVVSTALYPLQESEIRGKYELPYEQTYMPLVRDGDMIICRVNAPLVSQCFRFLRRGRKANILGRDLGSGLIRTIQSLKPTSVEDLIGKVGEWLATEVRREGGKRHPSEGRMIALQDRADCILCFTEGSANVEEVVKKIEVLFVEDPKTPGIKLSSIHRAKGLESARVFFLRPKGGQCPHPMARSAWQIEQEWNLLYVGITRAINELIYVY